MYTGDLQHAVFSSWVVNLFRILHACHGVLFKQLSAWMIYGILLDEYNEFFISMKTDNERKRLRYYLTLSGIIWYDNVAVEDIFWVKLPKFMK